MKQINLATTILCMLAIPVFSKFSMFAAYGYIGIFLLAIGWEKKKPAEGADQDEDHICNSIFVFYYQQLMVTCFVDSNNNVTKKIRAARCNDPGFSSYRRRFERYFSSSEPIPQGGLNPSS